LLLTARGDAADRIRGLQLGADDYLPKPFDPEELVARIRAIMRRGAPRSALTSANATDRGNAFGRADDRPRFSYGKVWS